MLREYITTWTVSRETHNTRAPPILLIPPLISRFPLRESWCSFRGLKVLCGYSVTALSKFALLRYLREIRVQVLTVIYPRFTHESGTIWKKQAIDVSTLKRLLCCKSQRQSQSNEKSLVQFDHEKAVSNYLGTQSTFTGYPVTLAWNLFTCHPQTVYNQKGTRVHTYRELIRLYRRPNCVLISRCLLCKSWCCPRRPYRPRSSRSVSTQLR